MNWQVQDNILDFLVLTRVKFALEITIPYFGAEELCKAR